jgi:hypothetical protein
VRGSRSGLHFYYELSREGLVEIDVFDLAGLLVGQFRASLSIVAEGNQAGPNTIGAREFRWKGDDLESGVYVYTIRAGSGENRDEARGKFAIIR